MTLELYNQDRIRFLDVSAEFIFNRTTPFVLEDFKNHLRAHKFRLSDDECLDFLFTNEYVFPLKNELYITRAGAFSNKLFSFKPHPEEIEKAAFIPGHRFMPFLNNQFFPWDAKVFFNGKEVEQVEVEMSTNLILDVHALLGEGYTVPFIFNDPATENEVEIGTTSCGLPKNLKVTAYSLKPFLENGFENGDRILCKISNWRKLHIEATIKKGNKNPLKFTHEDLEREEWYEYFENALLERFDIHGPRASIEEQLALLFLENSKKLCVPNCGAVEDFLEHTTKIGFVSYGIESRLWRINEDIPFIGPWNTINNQIVESGFPDLNLMLSNTIIDNIIYDNLFHTGKHGNAETVFNTVLPNALCFEDFPKKLILLNFKKRIDIINKNYSRFDDFPVVDYRHRIIAFYKRLANLLGEIIMSEPDFEKYPQEELISITQIFANINHILGGLLDEPESIANDIDSYSSSLESMADIFDAIEIPLKIAVKNCAKKKVFIKNKI